MRVGGGGGDWGFSVRLFEKESSDFSSEITNDHTIFFIINVTFGKKFNKKYQNILQYLSNCFFKFLKRA